MNTILLTFFLFFLRHPWLASHGFVVIRPDMRGSGDSEGLLFDEYLQQEQDDCCSLLGKNIQDKCKKGFDKKIEGGIKLKQRHHII